MELDAFAVVALLIAAAELALGVAALVHVGRVRRASSLGAAAPDDARGYAALLATAPRLALVGIASLPLLALHCWSLVERSAAFRCVRGVLRIGELGTGAVAWLPRLLAGMTVTKPALVVACGAAATLQAIDRESRTSPLRARVVTWMAIAGFLALADGAGQVAYVVIPKREVQTAGGCCNLEPNADDPVAGAVTPPAERTAWTVAFFGTGVATVALLAVGLRRGAFDGGAPGWWAAATAGAVATSATGAMFLVRALAPARLGLPFHECGFCALDAAPELYVGVPLQLASTAAVPLAWLAARAGRTDEVSDAAGAVSKRLLRFGAFGSAAALAMGAVERGLA